MTIVYSPGDAAAAWRIHVAVVLLPPLLELHHFYEQQMTLALAQRNRQARAHWSLMALSVELRIKALEA